MKLVIVLCLVALAQAQFRNRNPGGEAQILRYDNDYGFSNYKFGYETSDGTSHDQQGQLKNEGREDAAIAVQGRYTWVAPDGITYTVTYTADENGYQPQIEQGPGGAVPGAVVASLLG